ncbi:MAG: histidine kinase [Clostridiales bacterium]|nr:histidine kinase [Clostridiales bacterium]
MFNRIRGNVFGRLKLNKKFLLMYVFGVILPILTTDFFLIRSIYQTELKNQSYYRETAIDAYSNYIENLLAYDTAVASSIDLNKNLNTFMNTLYDKPSNYYKNYVNTISNSFFSTLTDYNRDRIIIYCDNNSIINGNYFHHLSEAENEIWYQKLIESGENQGVFAYYDYAPVLRTFDQKRFVYVRRMTNTKSPIEKIVTIEHRSWRITGELADIPVNCTMFVCCDDYLIYPSQDSTNDYQKLMEKVANEPYVTVREVQMYGTTFTIYAITEDLTITDVMKNNMPVTLLLFIVTLVIPILIMKLLEKSITDRISILGKAFGEGGNDILQPIKEIKGSDEISTLMHNYNRIVEINEELTQTIYKDKLREQESDLARKNAELLALQSQINPHFLFNALESIRMHSILKGETETAEMVQRLAVMERQNVEWHEDAVTIEEEEDFIDAYLQLQSYRFGSGSLSTSRSRKTAKNCLSRSLHWLHSLRMHVFTVSSQNLHRAGYS